MDGKITMEVLRRVVEAESDLSVRMAIQKSVFGDAFDAVKDQDDWRAPVNRLVRFDNTVYDPEVIANAVEYFTATKATIVYTAKGFRVMADGYRAGPAGP